MTDDQRRTWRGKPWERQPGESRPAWEAFCAYRDLGPDRSIMDAARKVGKAHSLLSRWAQKWAWEFRTDQLDAVGSRAEAKMVEHRVRRQAGTRAKAEVELANLSLAAAVLAFRRLHRSLQADPNRVLGVASTAELADVALKLRPILAGQPQDPHAAERVEGEIVLALQRVEDMRNRWVRAERAKAGLPPLEDEGEEHGE